ncbi:MAG: hypothetical protein QHJ73_19610, partial [Armatimonadota bacterium]|nr:hypothetical protein [Armatimonadota bacterium]
GTVHRTRAELRCAADALASPRSWQLRSWLEDLEGQPVPLTEVEESASVRGNSVQVKWGARSSTRRVPTPFTSNWSLFDAVQRLPAPAVPALTFALLEDLDLLKEKQQLSYRETTEVEWDDGTVRLQGYQQLGEGILPWHYWRDGARRLLFVVTGIRAYLWSPEAERRVEELVEAARRRTRRRAGEGGSNP